jgi:hypothetical protein
MVGGLAAGFIELGYEAIALPSPMSAEKIGDIAEQVGADVVMQVNRFRPFDPPLPPHIRHIAWFQDVFPDTSHDLNATERHGDIVYALGDANVLGLNVELPCFLGSLVTGVDPRLVKDSRGAPSQPVDFSLCGYIPAPLVFEPSRKSQLAWYLNERVDRIPLIGDSWTVRQLRSRLLQRYLHRGYVPYPLATALREATTALYRPLRGELDIRVLSGELRSAVEPYANLGTNNGVERFINMLTYDYPRLLDRVALIRAALEVSQSLELYGPGWDKHEQFRAYHKGTVNDPYALLSIFRRSRINLANNTHGLGLHSRTLECMAVGGFVFMHRSPHDESPGGMLTAFEPDVHYGAYTPETFREQATRWLRDEAGRIKVGAQAAAIIREKHLWRHRAQQIVEDLKR